MEVMVEVNEGRLTAVETNVEHLSKDVGEIKDDIKAIHELDKVVGENLVKLAMLAEQGQKRDEELIPRIAKLEAWQNKKDGVILIIVAVFSIFGDKIVKLLGL
jgi:hypothetical protein